MCGVVKDILPYSLIYGNRSILQGVNIIGLRRKNISNSRINNIKKTFDIIYKDNNHMANIKDIPEEIINDDCVREIVNFLNSDKKRPICTSQDNDENN
jgi:UDP-N-acetylglucosamine acyltransferase